MNKLILNKLLTCSLLFWLAGCAENKYTKTIDQLCPPAATKTAAMTAAEQVLADMHFAIEKFDVDAGYIRTAPLIGRTIIRILACRQRRLIQPDRSRPAQYPQDRRN